MSPDSKLNNAEPHKQLPASMYYELCATLADFHEATDDPGDYNYMSDGEWLDVFYNLCMKIKKKLK